jgi:hypothetical protein
MAELRSVRTPRSRRSYQTLGMPQGKEGDGQEREQEFRSQLRVLCGQRSKRKWRGVRARSLARCSKIAAS